jgi:cysteine protease ATG4
VLGKNHARESDWKEDIEALTWFSYRKNFPPMEPYGLTSDSGWGCMLRCAQMLMAQALKVHTLGRGWKPGTMAYRLRSAPYCALLRAFADAPGEAHLYSIHNFCRVGLETQDKLPGEWCVCHTLCFKSHVHVADMALKE